MSACYEGWSKENGNTSGCCCCGCKYQRTVAGHPWNSGEFKGRIGARISFACTVPDMEHIVLMQQEHGMCEMYTEKAPRQE